MIPNSNREEFLALNTQVETLEATVTRRHTENQQRFDRPEVRADEVFQTMTIKDELTAMENRLKDEMAAMEERLLEAIRAVVPPTRYGS